MGHPVSGRCRDTDCFAPFITPPPPPQSPHSQCRKLSKVYLVLSVDDTFNINKYKMQFFDIIGVDADGKTVMVAQALLAGKDTESYRWVFQQLKNQLFGLEPSVILSDGDPAIRAAILAEFPNSQHSLCVWHWKGELAVGAGATF